MKCPDCERPMRSYPSSRRKTDWACEWVGCRVIAVIFERDGEEKILREPYSNGY